MTQPQALLPRLLPSIRALVSLAALCAACALALPAHALQTGAPATAGPGRPGSPDSPRDALALTPAQTALWQAARAAAREAHAHALELRARFIREEGQSDATGTANAPEPSLRARAEREDHLHDALDKDRRAVRDRWIAFDESLDASQRKRLRAMPEAGRWPGPGGMPGPFADGAMPPHGPAPMPCAFGADGPGNVPGAAGPRRQGAHDAQ